MDRLKYLRGLTRTAQDLSIKACDVDKRLKCLRALVSLAIRNDPIPFSFNFPRVWLGQVKHVGEKMLEILESIYHDYKINPSTSSSSNSSCALITKGKYPSAAVAVLIELNKRGNSGLGIVELLDVVNPTLEFPFNHVLWEHEVVSCVSFDQIKILVSFQFIKEQHLSKNRVKKRQETLFTITESGKDLATKLEKLYLGVSVEVIDLVALEDDEKKRKPTVILQIDDREGGGKSKRLNDLLKSLDHYPDIAYETKALEVGDYAWIRRNPSSGKEENLPFICERKQIIDLAASLTDGRWERQQLKMNEFASKFPDPKSCSKVYIIEMDSKDALARWKCACGNRHIFKCGPGEATALDIKKALENLQTRGFKIIETYNWSKSAEFLASVTRKFMNEDFKDFKDFKDEDFKDFKDFKDVKHEDFKDFKDEIKDVEDIVEDDDVILLSDCDEIEKSQKLSSPSSPLPSSPLPSSPLPSPNLTSITFSPYSTLSPNLPSPASNLPCPTLSPDLPLKKRLKKDYSDLSLQDLRTYLRDRGENYSGKTRETLLELCHQPEKPQFLIDRILQGKWVPGDRCGAFAIFCIFDRELRKGRVSLTYDEFVRLADSSGILKEGKSLQRKQGKYYDAVTEFRQKAMSNNNHTLENPPLVVKVDNSIPAHWTLTDPLGRNLAFALHQHAHLRGYCKCEVLL